MIRNKVELKLPFKGEWTVVWGGDTEELNAHHHDPVQRFAFDFLISDDEGKTHRGEGRRNEDYYAFGKEILAPADGVVVVVIEGVPDNTPGSLNPYSALGNAVYIQHAEWEVSVLAHLKLGSVRVKVGDRVKQGDVIGLCGNSGNSSEPHLHYHLQNTPSIQNAEGVKCYFKDVLVRKSGRKELKREYSPLKGDKIEQG